MVPIPALDGAQLTRRPGRPTLRNVNATRVEIATAYGKAKTAWSAFPLGNKFGFAAAVLKPEKYRTIHNTAATNIQGAQLLNGPWTFTPPARPTAYDASITSTTADAIRRKKEAKRQEDIEAYATFLTYENKYKDLLEDAYDTACFATLRDDIFGLSTVTVSDMLAHLERQCLKLTAPEKAKKLTEIAIEWNVNDDIETYYSNVDKLEEELRDDYDIAWQESMKIPIVTDAMYKSSFFTETEMMEWEEKDDADKTWANFKPYFKDIWTMRSRYQKGGASPRNHGYESAANVTETNEEEDPFERLRNNLREVALAAANEKEHIQQMGAAHTDLLAVIKKQQEQLANLTEQNGKLLEQNGQLLAQAANKSPATPRNNSNRNRNNRQSNNKPKEDATKSDEAAAKPKSGRCAVCPLQSHDTKDCWELEINASKRPNNWVSIFKRGGDGE